jgi:hypothetical protein
LKRRRDNEIHRHWLTYIGLKAELQTRYLNL